MQQQQQQRRRRTRARDSRGRPVAGIYRQDDRFVAGARIGGKWTMRTLAASSLTEARRERESWLAGVREGRIAAPSAATFAAVFADWQASRAVSRRTLEDEQAVARVRLAPLLDRRVQDIGSAEVAALLRDLRARYAPWSCVQAYRVVAGVFAHALRRGLIARNPLDGLARSERPKQRNARRVARLDAATLARLIAAAPSLRWRVALALAGYAGLRVGELLALTWSDVDLDASTVTVRRSLDRDGTPKPPKTAAGVRTVPLLPALRRLLVEWRLRSPHSRPGDLVIATIDGKPAQARNLRRALEQAKRTAGLDATEERISPHVLRHSYASLLATDLALPAPTLAAIIGHADPGFTLRCYARDARDSAAVVADVLDRARRAGVGG
ncbi:MAG: site-specific integrase [Rhodospirillales bacterium]|nr:site-specific integrase [Rhodospirillales bacterium]